MYFSLIVSAQGREREAAHELAGSAYADHQWIWRFFQTPEGKPRDFIFRRTESGLPRFHVVSQRPPKAFSEAWEVRTRPYAPVLTEGDRLRFELRANPTVRHGRDGKSKRHDVVMEAKKRLLSERGLKRWGDLSDEERSPLYSQVHRACANWLTQQGTRNGFVVDGDCLSSEAYRQHGDNGGGALQFSSIDFSGELTVKDPAVMLEALYHGIGHAKAFGCGLLLIRRID